MTIAWLTYKSKHLHAGDVVDTKLFLDLCEDAGKCTSVADVKAFAVNYENSRIYADVVSGNGFFDISFVTNQTRSQKNHFLKPHQHKFWNFHNSLQTLSHQQQKYISLHLHICLLYTSDAADEEDSV